MQQKILSRDNELQSKRYTLRGMREELLGLVMVEEALEARERRLLLREQRRALRIETVRRVAISSVALTCLVLTIAGVAIPR
jgi:hypothetical protein